MIRIASGAGFWGDYPDAPGRLLERTGMDEDEDLEYLQLEYLAEVTMGILARLQESGRPGYATDFVELIIDEHLEELLDRDITVVTNAGGIDPDSCADRVAELAAERGRDPTIATVTGSEITTAVADLAHTGEISHLETGEPMPDDIEPLAAAAYLGAIPIRDALAADADIVITGRVADPALTLGPLLYEFDWSATDYDRLAAGTVAGHLIECGTQVTGGNFLGEWEDLSFTDIGYPIAEVTADGTVTITKPSGTGGAVTTDTVTEQLVYEIGDPTAYLTPDVTADFTSIELSEPATDRVQLAGITGHAPPDQLKATVHHQRGYKVAGQLLYSQPNALEKAKRAAAILDERIDELGLELSETHVEYIGHNAAHGPMAPNRGEYNEIMVRLAARGPVKDDLRRLGMEFAPLSMAGPPAVTGLTDGGRPSPTPVIDTWPTLVSREHVDPEVTIRA
ncbi:acyclic terpene utilization AtuA family protein [Halobaculum sp. EA56]|uniref:acyclic terpene utilization AtuA family protein n=1 Tax=Halobaculum sp. EA56 TaxID=3421648 RepID=UPI003EBE3F27